MDCSRRDFCAALPLLAGVPSGSLKAAGTLPSRIYQYDQLPTRRIRTVVSRALFDGKLYEGCEISMHESELDPESAPHPPHRHRHEEMVFVVEGELEFTVNGTATRAGSGSVLFAGTNDLHGIRNPTTKPARYFVLALGPGKE